MQDIGKKIHHFCKELWPINRSLTGEGVRQSLDLIQQKIPEKSVSRQGFILQKKLSLIFLDMTRQSLTFFRLRIGEKRVLKNSLKR